MTKTFKEWVDEPIDEMSLGDFNITHAHAMLECAKQISRSLHDADPHGTVHEHAKHILKLSHHLVHHFTHKAKKFVEKDRV